MFRKTLRCVWLRLIGWFGLPLGADVTSLSERPTDHGTLLQHAIFISPSCFHHSMLGVNVMTSIPKIWIKYWRQKLDTSILIGFESSFFNNGDYPLSQNTPALKPIAHWAAIQDKATSVGTKHQRRQSDRYTLLTSALAHYQHTHEQQF